MMAMLSAIGVCHRSSAAFAARYQLVRSVKIEQTSPGFAGGALLQPLNTINTPQQAFRNLHDSAREQIGKEPELRDEPVSEEVFRTSGLKPCRPAGLNRSKPARLHFSLIGCWPFTSVSPWLFPWLFPWYFMWFFLRLLAVLARHRVAVQSRKRTIEPLFPGLMI